MCIYQERQVFNIIVFQKLPKHSFSLLNVLFIVICSIYHIDDALGSGVIKLPLRAHIVTAAKVYKVDVAWRPSLSKVSTLKVRVGVVGLRSQRKSLFRMVVLPEEWEAKHQDSLERVEMLH